MNSKGGLFLPSQADWIMLVMESNFSTSHKKETLHSALSDSFKMKVHNRKLIDLLISSIATLIEKEKEENKNGR